MARAKQTKNGQTNMNNNQIRKKNKKKKNSIKPLGLSINNKNPKIISTIQNIAQEFRDIQLQKQLTRTVHNDDVIYVSSGDDSNDETDASFITIDQTSFYNKESTNDEIQVLGVKKNLDDSCVIVQDTGKDFLSLAGKTNRRKRPLLSTTISSPPVIHPKDQQLQQTIFRLDVTSTPLAIIKARNNGGRIVKRKNKKLAFKISPRKGGGVPQKYSFMHQALQLEASNAALENSQNESFWGPAVKACQKKKRKKGGKPGGNLVPVNERTKRQIVVDGQNVARGHGIGKFSPVGIKLCVEYFERRGHKVVVFLPNCCMGLDSDYIFKNLEKKGTLIYTPSRKVSGQRQQPYDDRYILEYASLVGGIVVSRDQYRDLLTENPQFRETIVSRLLMYTFVGDYLMFPLDPLGPSGPCLEEFLRFPTRVETIGPTNTTPTSSTVTSGDDTLTSENNSWNTPKDTSPSTSSTVTSGHDALTSENTARNTPDYTSKDTSPSTSSTVTLGHDTLISTSEYTSKDISVSTSIDTCGDDTLITISEDTSVSTSCGDDTLITISDTSLCTSVLPSP